MKSIPFCNELRFTEKCEYRLGGSKGAITSPNHPSNYPGNLDCSYYLTLRVGAQIKLKFETFDLEKTSQCDYDYLKIQDGGDSSAPVLGKYCGNTKPSDVTSSKNKLYLRFVSDARNAGKGFKLSWEEVKEEGK